MPPLPISVPVVTCNEERNLERCLRSLEGLASEVLVMDSGSTDGTRAVAERFGARWMHQDWLGFRDQKNAVLAHCRQPWVLALDADEELSPAMRSEVIAFFNGPDREYAGASFPRKVWFLGRWITHGDWYPDRKLRLVKREGARWGGSPEHDRLEIDGRILACRGDLHHFSFPDMNRFIQKTALFGDEYLRRQLAAGARWSLLQTIFRPWWRFVRGYIIRRGFLDGFPGFWIATGVAWQAFVRHSRLYEHQSRRQPPDLQ